MFSFDRAAGYYDATRGLPSDVANDLTDRLVAELDGRRACLELGVGTGRIALPLHDRGIRLIGSDIAPAMLHQLAVNAGGVAPFPLVLADATRLPLVDGSVDAVLASHVLHLVPDWRRAVDELRRVLRPGGVLLADFGNHPPSPWSEPTNAIFRRHGVVRVRPGVSSPEEVAEYAGTRARPLDAVTLTATRSLAQDLSEWEAQIHSWTWPYAPEQLRPACDDIRRWAEQNGVDLDDEVTLERRIQWWAFEFTDG